MNNRRRISRRVVLRGAVLSLGAATTATMVSRAAAQQKLSQTDAKYQTTPKGEQHCDGCVNSTSRLRMRANSSTATSARTAGASCLARSPSPSRPVHFVVHNSVIRGIMPKS
jgi:hypothetical protein